MSGQPCPECNEFVPMCTCGEWDCGFYSHLRASCPSERASEYRKKAKATVARFRDNSERKEPPLHRMAKFLELSIEDTKPLFDGTIEVAQKKESHYPLVIEFEKIAKLYVEDPPTHREQLELLVAALKEAK